VVASQVYVESMAEKLPMSVNGEQDTSEEIRLKYRFLDLRREKIHQNIVLRSKIIQEIQNLQSWNSISKL
jgi:aspartyl-tRNA synthetase